MTATDETTSTGGSALRVEHPGSYPPPQEFAERANVTAEAYDRADADRLAFWEAAADRLTWETRWSTTLEWESPFARWFVGGRLNVAVNCVDRHVESGHGDRVAIHWVGEPDDDARDLTYADLRREVARAAHALTELGVSAGDRVAVYLPMIPEAVITMLACARIGAVHSVVFAGFSATALADRITDADATVVVTADGQFRRGDASALKPAVDEAVAKTGDTVRSVLVVRRTGVDVEWDDSRDVWWHDLVDRQPDTHEAEAFDAEHPLYVLYTSGSTGRPKGILHTSGGYLTQAAWTHHAVMDLKPETDVYWCAADVGWVTGHSYITYGPLANGATQIMYEGTPTPTAWWQIVQRYGVTSLYTAPTTIRTFMKWGEEHPQQFDLSSLRLLGTVGEPINPEAWRWYHRVIGGERCPVVDTWWQTETGAMMMTPLPGVHAQVPGSAMAPLPGIAVDVVDEDGTSVGHDESGLLVVTEPWPSMLRGIWGDEQRYRDTYWSRFGGRYYFAGDGARRDADGNIWVTGRVDDVINVSGHRLSTSEVESSLVAHPKVAEAAVIGAADDTSGQAIFAFVSPNDDVDEAEWSADSFEQALRDHVAHDISPIAKPKRVLVSHYLPKTRSGKIMRRLLRAVSEGGDLGDTSTLADPSVVERLRDRLQG